MRVSLLFAIGLYLFVSSCNRNYNAVLPTYDGWEVLLLEDKRGARKADRVDLLFSANQVPLNYERLVLITAPVYMDQIGAAEWSIAREYAAYYGADGVFLQPNTAAFNFRNTRDSLQYYDQQRLPARGDERQANFFAIRYQ